MTDSDTMQGSTTLNHTVAVVGTTAQFLSPVTATLPANPLIEGTEATAAGRIEDEDTEQAHKWNLGVVLAGVGRHGAP